jgi:hypothetical protein
MQGPGQDLVRGKTCKYLVRDSSHLFLVPLYKSIQSGNKVEAAEGQQSHG